MQVALIAPKNLLELTRLGDMHFIVPQNADEQFFRKETMYKMLDNGTYETGHPIALANLLTLAGDLKVDEIVLPDVMLDKLETVSLVAHATTVRKPKGLKYAAVPQGKNPKEFIDCYKQFAKFPEIDVLCFPIWLQKLYNARFKVVNYLLKRKLLAHKKHHLIGLDSIGELYSYPKGVIRSLDTSLPFSAGMERKALSDFDTFQGPRINLKFAKFGSEHLDYFKWNIGKLLEAAQYA